MGGALGSVSRYLITIAANTVPGGSSLVGTTVANVLGCGLIGALSAYGAADGNLNERMALALRVGFLGGLTTFSTFAAESAGLATDGRWMGSGLYVAVNLFLDWIALVAGSSVVKAWMA